MARYGASTMNGSTAPRNKIDGDERCDGSSTAMDSERTTAPQWQGTAPKAAPPRQGTASDGHGKGQRIVVGIVLGTDHDNEEGMVPNGHGVFLFRLLIGCDYELLRSERRRGNGGSGRGPAEAGKQGPIIIWVGARCAWDHQKAWCMLIGVERQVAGPGAKVAYEQVVGLEVVV